MSMYRRNSAGYLSAIEPAVERPTKENQVWRQIKLAVLLFFIYCVAAAGAIITALLIGQWSGAIIAAGVIIYGMRLRLRNTPHVEWNARAKIHKRVLLALLAFAGALLLLNLLGQWPEFVQDPSEHKLLWYTWHYDSGTFYWYAPRSGWYEMVWIVWARLALIVVIPLALPRILKLLWYRYSVEIAYPSWSDSVVARGRKFGDPLDLLTLIGDIQQDDPAIVMTSRPNDDGGKL